MNKRFPGCYRPARRSTQKPRCLAHEKDDVQKLKQFLEVEKNTFECIKPFLTFSFMLNVAWIAALFVRKEHYAVALKGLSHGAYASLIFYMLSFLFFLMHSLALRKGYKNFITSRHLAYLMASLGFISSVVFFGLVVDSLF